MLKTTFSRPFKTHGAQRLHVVLLVALSLVSLASLPARQAQAHTSAQALPQPEAQMIQFIKKNRAQALRDLEMITKINSGTSNLAGVRAVGRFFESELQALGFKTQWLDMRAVGRAGHLFAQLRPVGKKHQGQRLLLIGHLDTVFEADSPFQDFEIQGQQARGPGVIDAKGGNLLMLQALKALHAVGALEQAHITVALMGDEENAGLPLSTSRRALIDAAQDSDVALGFEYAVNMNSAVVARRGFSQWKLTVQGRQGHSSRIFTPEAGSGAIFEAARILQRFYAELRQERYLSFNAGVILGGTELDYDGSRFAGEVTGKNNVIPKAAVVEGGLRFISQAQKERARAQMRAIVADSLPGTMAQIEFTDEYPAMAPRPGNYKLLQMLSQVSQDLGLGPVSAVDPGLKGAADISFVGEELDALDALGALGSGAHSPQESLDLESFPHLTQRTALFVYRLLQSEGAD